MGFFEILALSSVSIEPGEVREAGVLYELWRHSFRCCLNGSFFVLRKCSVHCKDF